MSAALATEFHRATDENGTEGDPRQMRSASSGDHRSYRTIAKLPPTELRSILERTAPQWPTEFLNTVKSPRDNLIQTDVVRKKNVKPPYRQEVLQQWEGRVTAVSENEFTARLVDITKKHSQETEEADFLTEEISSEDRLLLRENAIFRWIVGYRYEGSTKIRFGKIVFRRMPAWSRKELEAASREATELFDGIIWS